MSERAETDQARYVEEKAAAIASLFDDDEAFIAVVILRKAAGILMARLKIPKPRIRL